MRQCALCNVTVVWAIKMSSYRTYGEVVQIATFRDRFEYLKLGGSFGRETFGDSRYLNQRLYTSREWRDLRHEIIVRDNGCDLGVSGFDIGGSIIIHHIEPLTIDMVLDRSSLIFDPENLICVSYSTHKALHYGDISMAAISQPAERSLHDTCPWKGGHSCPTVIR